MPDNSHLHWFQISKSRDALYETDKDIANIIYKSFEPVLSKGLRILDPTAGSGRLLMPFKKAGFDVFGIEYNEKTYDRLKKNIGKESSRCGHLLDYQRFIERKNLFDVAVMNPPFGLTWECEDNNLFLGEDVIESQAGTIEVALDAISHRGLVAMIIPTSTWKNAKDKALVDYIRTNLDVYAIFTIPKAFKKEYGINVETDLVFGSKRQGGYYYFNDTIRETVELANLDVIPIKVHKQLQIAKYQKNTPIRFEKNLNSKIPDLGKIEVKEQDKLIKDIYVTSKKVVGDDRILSLLNFYDSADLEDYNPILGKETGISEAYFSIPSIIRNGITKTKEYAEQLGLTLKMKDSEKVKFQRLREKWKIEALPLYRPKSHELLAYFKNIPYKANKDLILSGKKVFIKGHDYLIKPTWTREEEVVEENDYQDKKGETIRETKSVESGYLQLDVVSEIGRHSYPENNKEMIKEFVSIFGLPEVKSVAEVLPERVKNWSNVVAKKYPILFDYQAEDLIRSLTKRNVYFGFEQGGGKCVHKSTLINVDGKLKTAEKIWETYASKSIIFDGEGYWSKPNKEMLVNSYNEKTGKIELKAVSNLYRQKVKEELIKLVLANGTVITTTQSHKYLTNGGVWKNNLSVNDYVAIPKKILNTSLDDECEITENLASLYGWQVSEGWESKTNRANSLTITQSKRGEELLELCNCVKKEYGFADMKPVLYKPNNGRAGYISFHSKQYRNYYQLMGGVWGKISKDKTIPSKLLESPINIVKAFLRSLFDGDGGINKEKNYVEYTSASKVLSLQLQYLLLRFGINSTIKKKTKYATNGTRTKRDYYELKMSGENAKTFIEKIGFGYTHKNKINQKLRSNSNIYGYYVRDLFNQILEVGGGHDSKYFGFSNLFSANNSGKWGKSYLANKETVKNVIDRLKYITDGRYEAELSELTKNKKCRHIQKLERFKLMDIAKLQKIATKLEDFINSDLVYIKVSSVSKMIYEGYVYDLEVAENHNFIANNVLVHNTITAMAYAEARQYQRVLVICQGGLIDNWLNEAEKFNFKATAIKSHYDINRLKKRIHDNDFEVGKTEFFIIGQEFLSLDGGKIYDEWKCERVDEDGEVIHSEFSIKGKCSKNHKYEVMNKVCPKCNTHLNNGWTGRYCKQCGYRAYSYGRNEDTKGINQYPAYKRLKKLSFSCVITDESQNFANRSLRGEASRTITSKSKVMLTGTIMRNYVSDVFLNFGWLMGYSNPVFYFNRQDAKRFLDEFGSYEVVTKQYLKEMNNASYRNRRGGRKKLLPIVSNLNRFWRLISPFTVRRLSMDVDELKKIKRNREIVWLDMDEEHQAMYEEYEAWAKSIIDAELRKEDDKVNMGVISKCLWKLRFACTHPNSPMLIDERGASPNIQLEKLSWNKLDKLVEILDKKKKKNEKTIVFTGLRLLQEYTKEYLKSKGFIVKYVDAKVKTKDRFQEVKDFNENRYDVLVTGSNILNRGYTITGANNVVFLDLDYTPEITDQGEFRVIRPGQEKEVFIYYLLNRLTIDEEMLAVNNLKRTAIQHAINKQAVYSDTAQLLAEMDARNPELLVAKNIHKKQRPKRPKQNIFPIKNNGSTKPNGTPKQEIESNIIIEEVQLALFG